MDRMCDIEGLDPFPLTRPGKYLIKYSMPDGSRLPPWIKGDPFGNIHFLQGHPYKDGEKVDILYWVVDREDGEETEKVSIRTTFHQVVTFPTSQP